MPMPSIRGLKIIFARAAATMAGRNDGRTRASGSAATLTRNAGLNRNAERGGCSNESNQNRWHWAKGLYDNGSGSRRWHGLRRAENSSGVFDGQAAYASAFSGPDGSSRYAALWSEGNLPESPSVVWDDNSASLSGYSGSHADQSGQRPASRLCAGSSRASLD